MISFYSNNTFSKCEIVNAFNKFFSSIAISSILASVLWVINNY